MIISADNFYENPETFLAKIYELICAAREVKDILII